MAKRAHRGCRGTNDAPARAGLSFPIAGVCASITGLKTLENFVENLPPDSGMAFVIVQHPAAHQEKLTAERLAPHARMPMHQVSEDVVVRPNNIYLSAPNSGLTIESGRLHISTSSESRQGRGPVDLFFRSLAEDQGSNAMCILLPGADEDGMPGLKAIKQNGGTILAQGTGGAISSGLVDCVLTAEEMPAKLMVHGSQIAESGDAGRDAIRAPAEDQLSRIHSMLTRGRFSSGIEELEIANEELRAFNEELQTLMRSAPAAIWIAHDPDCRVVTTNPAGSAIFRMNVGPNVSITAAEQGEAKHFEIYRDGVLLAPEDLPLQVCARTGRPLFDQELELRFDDGTTLWKYGNAAPLFDENGKPRGAVATFLDVTQRKLATEQLRKAQDEVRARAGSLEQLVAKRTQELRDKIEQLETFSYSISHDLRGPLRAMQGFAQILLEEHWESLNDKGREYLNRIVRSANRMDAHTRDVLTYSQIVRGRVNNEPIDVETVIRDVVNQMSSLQNSNASLTIETPLAPVIGNEVLLTQCLSNFLANAVKFAKPGTAPQIQIATEVRDGKVFLWVRDQGVGVAAENHSKIFGMFQRLDTGVEGTGIGLAICKKAVERMNGRIGIESEIGRGSSFWIELPAAPAEKNTYES